MTSKDRRQLRRDIVAVLSPELLRPEYRKRRGKHRLFGHCYVATEAMYHLCGGTTSGYCPQVIRHEGGTHWYLKKAVGSRITDLTAAQFATPVPYAQGRGCGFLTTKPSQRTCEVIERVQVRRATRRRRQRRGTK